MIDQTTIYFLLFGLPSWAIIDGTWSILSILANVLPEDYNISAYLILMLTLGNLISIIISYVFLGLTLDYLDSLINLVLTLGLMNGIFLSIFWDYTINTSSGHISLPFYLLFLSAGLCSSLSNITHYTFTSVHLDSFTSWLSTGMGLGSMISGVLGIIFSVISKDNELLVRVFYAILALLYLPAIFSYKQLQKLEIQPKDEIKEEFEFRLIQYPSVPSAMSPFKIISRYFTIFLLLGFNSSLGYGFIPAIISYTCGKFNHSRLILMLSTGIAATIDPLAKSFTIYYRLKHKSSLILASLMLLLLACLLIIAATLPSDSILYKNGEALPVVLYIVFSSLFGFTNTCIFRYFKDEIDEYSIQQTYRYCGVASQLGSLCGSLLAFLLVITNSL